MRAQKFVIEGVCWHSSVSRLCIVRQNRFIVMFGVPDGSTNEHCLLETCTFWVPENVM